MPRKKIGYTFVLIEFPDDMLAAVREKAGERGLTAFVCEQMAKCVGATYTPPKRGAPTLEEREAKKKPAKRGRAKK